MMRKCHLNTCPVGVATQNPELRKRFIGKSQYLVNYFRFIATEVREIMAEMGFRKFEDLVAARISLNSAGILDHWKARKLDLSQILYRPGKCPKMPPIVPAFRSIRSTK